MSPQRSKRQAFTLLEIALVVSVAGMVLAVAVPTFIDSLETSKAAEASQQLATLFRNSAAYYAVPRPTSDGKTAYCLPAPAGPTPLTPSVNPVPVDFKADDTPGVETWRALEFAPSVPLRYRYTFLPRGPACLVRESTPPATLVLRAEGDLDGDGTLSRFERRASLRDRGELEGERMLHIADRIE
ncbi:MAG TPA: type II secretion system protein [Polyangiales bacterium]|nr:type II secretion system protein [Polyangiales bacterium]